MDGWLLVQIMMLMLWSAVLVSFVIAAGLRSAARYRDDDGWERAEQRHEMARRENG